MTDKEQVGKCGFHYESVIIAIFTIIFFAYVLFNTYRDQDYKKSVFKESTYVFSQYQLKNGVYLSYIEDTDKYSHVVLHLTDKEVQKILIVKNEFLEDPNGPLSQLSKSFSAQQEHFLHKNTGKKYSTEIKKAIIPSDASLPSLKHK